MLLAIGVWGTLHSALAREVYIEADEQVGRGYLFYSANDCFALVPLHVVEDGQGDEAFEISLYRERIFRKEGEIAHKYANDIAVVAFKSNDRSLCDKAAADPKPGVDNTTYLYSADKDGGATRTYVVVREDRGDIILVEADDPSRAVTQKMSGSILYHGGRAVGMLGTVRSKGKKGEEGAAASPPLGVVKKWDFIARMMGNKFNPAESWPGEAEFGSQRLTPPDKAAAQGRANAAGATSTLKSPIGGTGLSFFIEGEVREAGEFSMGGGRVILRKALQMGGGPTSTAATRNITVKSANGSISERARLTLPITPGDRIIVPAK